jgi:Asp-tRNA(Asn)/Glu-tRNA(Gln) amidotransferase A subunit family amidase
MNQLPSSTRRRFLQTFSTLGLGSTLLPGVLWAKLETGPQASVTAAMIKEAAAIAGLEFSDQEIASMVQAVNLDHGRYAVVRAAAIPNDVAPPFYFSPLVPGMVIEPVTGPSRFSPPGSLPRPANLEDAAFWSVQDLAGLLQSRAVTSEELTRMYLGRLHRLNEKLNCVVTFLDEPALEQARKADVEIAAGHYRGPLHGMPWGAKDIIAVKDHKTTWGSGAYQEQTFDQDATVVELLRDAGAVLLAKLTTGELAGGDVWFGGRTNNPWKLDQGASGSSAGPGAAAAAGAVPFAIGTETSGSILGPSARCGATGLRPTFGRVSRRGVMALSWTQDRLGPICRYVEDCAIVMAAIARPDGHDLAVTDRPFHWDVTRDFRKLRVGFFADAFADTDRNPAWIKNDQTTLADLREMGFELIPLTVPDFPALDALNLSVESATFFDELLRSGRHELLTVKTKADRYRTARMIPAVEYLQSQRLRAMMMAALASATAAVDVYVAPYSSGFVTSRPPAGAPQPPPNVTQQHTQMANLACYPAVALPNGFTPDGTPSSITFYARPYGEAALLTLAKAYQNATGYHLQQPTL